MEPISLEELLMQWDQVVGMLSNSFYALAMVLGAVIFAYMADKRAHAVQRGEHERIGDKIDHTGERTGEKIDHTAEKIDHTAEKLEKSIIHVGETLEKGIVHTKEVMGTGISGIAQKVDDIGKTVGDIHLRYEVQKLAYENFDDTQKDIMASVRKIEGLGLQLEQFSKENRELKDQLQAAQETIRELKVQLQMVQQRNLEPERKKYNRQEFSDSYQGETDWEMER